MPLIELRFSDEIDQSKAKTGDIMVPLSHKW